jgi:hypothetical protein
VAALRHQTVPPLGCASALRNSVFSAPLRWERLFRAESFRLSAPFQVEGCKLAQAQQLFRRQLFSCVPRVSWFNLRNAI